MIRNLDIVFDVAAGVCIGGFAIMMLMGTLIQVAEARKRKQFFVPATWQFAIFWILIAWFVVWRLLSG